MNTEEIDHVKGVPVRGWKFADGALKYDQTMAVTGIFILRNIFI